MKYSKKFKYVRKIMFFIYDFRCQVCGKETFNLELHHADYDNQNDNLFNLIPLCNFCHKTIHKSVKVHFTDITQKVASLLIELNKKLNKF